MGSFHQKMKLLPVFAFASAQAFSVLEVGKECVGSADGTLVTPCEGAQEWCNIPEGSTDFKGKCECLPGWPAAEGAKECAAEILKECDDTNVCASEAACTNKVCDCSTLVAEDGTTKTCGDDGKLCDTFCNVLPPSEDTTTTVASSESTEKPVEGSSVTAALSAAFLLINMA